MRSAVVRSAIAVGALASVGMAPASVQAQSPAEVVIVGDSITANEVEIIRATLTGAGHDSVHYAALGARRIDESYEWHGWRNSGVDEISSVMAAGADPDLWVVELGTNDLPKIADPGWMDPVWKASLLIDRVLEEIGPGEQVAWVTVLDRHDRRSSRLFNAALRRRAGADERLVLIEWHRLADDRPEWFDDHVHPNELGASALAGLYAGEIDEHRRREGD